MRGMLGSVLVLVLILSRASSSSSSSSSSRTSNSDRDEPLCEMIRDVETCKSTVGCCYVTKCETTTSHRSRARELKKKKKKPALKRPFIHIRSKRNQSEFNIDLILNLNSLPNFTLTNSARSVLIKARDMIEPLINETFPKPHIFLPSDCGAVSSIMKQRSIKDLLIIVDVSSTYSGVAAAGPCVHSSEFNKTRVGVAIASAKLLNINEIDQDSENFLLSILIHEFMHILGIGTLWASFGLKSEKNEYTGQNLVNVYNQNLRGSGKPMIEADFGPGSAGSHFDECLYDDELMTPVVGSGRSPISLMTCSALIDLGYRINLHLCDNQWKIPRKVFCRDGYRLQLQTSSPLLKDVNVAQPQQQDAAAHTAVLNNDILNFEVKYV